MSPRNRSSHSASATPKRRADRHSSCARALAVAYHDGGLIAFGWADRSELFRRYGGGGDLLPLTQQQIEVAALASIIAFQLTRFGEREQGDDFVTH